MVMKQFVKRDEEFECENCHKKVSKLSYTSRDHCPYCLCSKHVDILPGDREEKCRGVLKPIQVEIDSKKGYVIVYKCEKCGKIFDFGIYDIKFGGIDDFYIRQKDIYYSGVCPECK